MDKINDCKIIKEISFNFIKYNRCLSLYDSNKLKNILNLICEFLEFDNKYELIYIFNDTILLSYGPLTIELFYKLLFNKKIKYNTKIRFLDFIKYSNNQNFEVFDYPKSNILDISFFFIYEILNDDKFLLNIKINNSFKLNYSNISNKQINCKSINTEKESKYVDYNNLKPIDTYSKALSCIESQSNIRNKKKHKNKKKFVDLI